MIETIVVTGAAGYIGSALINKLVQTKYRIIAVDNLMYGGESLMTFMNIPNFRFIKADICNTGIMRGIISGADYVINLAALVGEPICKRWPNTAQEVNCDAAIKLVRLCIDTNVKRFFFADTCSNYGKLPDNEIAKESTKLEPLSWYSKTKVAAEKFILDIDELVPCTVFRFGTAYGISGRTRFDLLLNQFVVEMWQKGKIKLFTPDSYRPIVHVDDIADLVVEMTYMQDDFKAVYNVAEDNYTKRQLAEFVKKEFGGDIEVVDGEPDPRSYRVSTAKIKNKIGFRPKWSPDKVVHQLRCLLDNGIITTDMLKRNVNSNY